MLEGKPLRILDFDCEARPDAYLGGDLTTRSLTAIAWQFIGTSKPSAVAIVAGGYPHATQMRNMLEDFRAAYDAADMVTGHNLIRYDLPVINGHMAYHGLKPLAPKLAQDTLLHGPKSALAFSRSLENMAQMLGVAGRGKHHMSNTTWKVANTLDPAGVEETLERVTSDVLLHIDVRQTMLDRGLLKPPKMWRP